MKKKKVTFLKGRYCKIRTPIRWNFCGKPGRRTFFIIKKIFQISIKDKEIISFNLNKKKAKKSYSTHKTLVTIDLKFLSIE